LRKILYRVEVGYSISTLRQNASDQLFLLGIDKTTLGVGLQRERRENRAMGFSLGNIIDLLISRHWTLV